ncbi:NnrS family protein (plasmid) [Paracoccus marcusii]|uniref:NnrS family protein n=1 Tax=Paracoccus marcusii TaxID=59779 RepID=UPI002ED02F66|nr:NnrS family protein [Paracoccus marcusii]
MVRRGDPEMSAATSTPLRTVRGLVTFPAASGRSFRGGVVDLSFNGRVGADDVGAPDTSLAFDPVSWHAHEFLFGYLGAVIAGFLLTAVSNWTGRPPSLAGLLGRWRFVADWAPDHRKPVWPCQLAGGGHRLGVLLFLAWQSHARSSPAATGAT